MLAPTADTPPNALPQTNNASSLACYTVFLAHLGILKFKSYGGR